MDAAWCDYIRARSVGKCQTGRDKCQRPSRLVRRLQSSQYAMIGQPIPASFLRSVILYRCTSAELRCLIGSLHVFYLLLHFCVYKVLQGCIG